METGWSEASDGLTGECTLWCTFLSPQPEWPWEQRLGSAFGILMAGSVRLLNPFSLVFVDNVGFVVVVFYIYCVFCPFCNYFDVLWFWSFLRVYVANLVIVQGILEPWSGLKWCRSICFSCLAHTLQCVWHSGHQVIKALRLSQKLSPRSPHSDTPPFLRYVSERQSYQHKQQMKNSPKYRLCWKRGTNTLLWWEAFM